MLGTRFQDPFLKIADRLLYINEECVLYSVLPTTFVGNRTLNSIIFYIFGHRTYWKLSLEGVIFCGISVPKLIPYKVENSLSFFLNLPLLPQNHRVLRTNVYENGVLSVLVILVRESYYFKVMRMGEVVPLKSNSNTVFWQTTKHLLFFYKFWSIFLMSGDLTQVITLLKAHVTIKILQTQTITENDFRYDTACSKGEGKDSTYIRQ